MRTFEIKFLVSGLCVVEASYSGAEAEIVGVFYTIADAERAFPMAWYFE